MIKFEIPKGYEHDKQKARQTRDHFKPMLSGMRCAKCNQDTIIGFYLRNDYGHTYHVYPQIKACCPEFKKRVLGKLGIQEMPDWNGH